MNRNRKKVLISVIVVFALICVGACGFLVYKAVMTLKAKDDYMELVAAATASNTEITKPSVNVDVTENPFDIAALEEENPDIYSWLYVPDTNISYPVLQSADSDNFWEVYQNNFNLIHQNFFKRLKEKYPDLTPTDLRFCALLRLNLSTKDIAQFTGLSVRGVEGARYRLRRKLDLPEGTNLVEFLIHF